MSDLFTLSEEHREIRAAVRAVCEAKVAPYAAEVDEQARYPEEAEKALRQADFHAPHVPEEYGGAGADALATVLVIEEIARVDASASLIPAVNKLGSMPIILSGSEELKQQVLPTIASGESMISYALSEREAGSDAASMRTREPSMASTSPVVTSESMRSATRAGSWRTAPGSRRGTRVPSAV